VLVCVDLKELYQLDDNQIVSGLNKVLIESKSLFNYLDLNDRFIIICMNTLLIGEFFMIKIDYVAGPFPSTQEYQNALENIFKHISEKQFHLLINHYKAPNHTITAEQLGKTVGYTYRGTNSQYGQLASLLCMKLGRDINSDKVYILLTTNYPKTKNVHRLLTLRPQVVQAIINLNWI